MTEGSDPTTTTTAAGRGGRKRDPARDPVILAAALDVLAEVGYERMTLDAVAARARAGKATLYRRWPTKEHLVLAAIAGLGRPYDDGELPDTGRLRSDLMAVIDDAWPGGPEQRVRIFAGLASAITSSTPLAKAVDAQITEPWVDVYRTLLRRAADRGEVSRDADVETLALIVPAMTTYRMTHTAQPPDEGFFRSIVEHVLLPAAGLAGVTA